MSYRNAGPLTMVSGEALAAFRAVKISASTAVYADAGEEHIGFTDAPVADGAMAAIIPANSSGVVGWEAAKAITSGSTLYAAVDGKCSDAAVGTKVGIAITAAGAAGGIVTAFIYGTVGGNDVLSARGGLIEFFDDFFHYDATLNWAVAEDAGATAPDAVEDGVGGILNVGCDGDDNDECYVSSILEVFKFAANKPLFFETRITLTEANTNEANFIIGLSDTVAADSLVDDGAGVMASFDGAVFYKVDGTMKIMFMTSNAAAQVDNADVEDFVSAQTYKLGFAFDPGDGVTGTITPFVDGVAGTAHDITLAGLAEMHVVMGVKAGGANEEGLKVDYVHCVAAR